MDGGQQCFGRSLNRFRFSFGLAQQIPAAEYAALVDLYNSTQGQAWTLNEGWNDPAALSWFGVTISGFEYDPGTGQILSVGTVTGLDLNGNQLNGSMPNSLGNLVNLQSLLLGVNQLSGSIPESLGNLVNLRFLELSNNQLSGSIPDFSAIAPDKTALVPGATATFANYTSYSKGLNGLMVDIAGLGGAPSLADFVFKVGNDNSLASWAAAPAPASITLRSGAGTGGSDRVAILWADNAIQKQWLQVTVKATANTGLATDDVFYFGNAIGESGNSATDARVTTADGLRTRANGTLSATIDNRYDYNRDGRVASADQLIARSNLTFGPLALQLISVP